MIDDPHEFSEGDTATAGPNVTQILRLRAAGHVQRCHTNQHHGLYLISEHVGQAICLLFTLHPMPSQNLVRALAFHDHPEILTGDIPAPAKRKIPLLRDYVEQLEAEYYEQHPLAQSGQLTDDDARWLKAIDSLELYLWCRDQELLGNQHATLIAEKVIGYLRTDGTPEPVLRFLETEMTLTWRDRCFE